MSRYAACLMLACFAIAAALHAPMSASTVRHSAGDVEILVDGSPQRRYLHQSRWYVEAQKGREYAIRLRNPFGVRVAVALSVDGLNTIDARETTASDARKWVLGPYETVTISGWQTSQSVARRFEFTTEERSYGQALGKTANLGMISAVFFRERTAHMMSHRSMDHPAASPAPMEKRQSAPAAQDAAGAANSKSAEEYAATGMGRSTGHVVTQVRLDLEETPAQSVNIRYEFRPQLVRLGILPAAQASDPLQRREKATGFAPGFCPEPPRHR